MTLEDQIRRMGEARAAEVTTPSWRDRVGAGRRTPWLVVAAAAAVVALAIGAFAVLADNDDADTDVAGPDSGLRWIPAGGVERIDYPGEAASFAQFAGWPEVALVTPDGRTDVGAEEVTRLFGGSTPYRGNSSPAEDFSLSIHPDGLVSLSLDRGEDVTVARIQTRRFTTEELEARAPDLLGLSTDLVALADAIASWDDGLEVAYVGQPVPIKAMISADDARDDAVFWLDTASKAQFLATGSEFFEGLFALDSAADYTLTEDYLGFSGVSSVVGVTDSEWLVIVDDVLGTDPLVDFPGSELLSNDPGAPRLATPAAEPVLTDDGEWTLALRFAEPTTFRDGGGVVATLGGVTLAFGLAEPGVEFTSLAVPTRMIEAEARRYAELINGYFADVPPPETTASPYPTTGPIQSGICAANPVPSDDVLDLATHVAADRTPLDLDQDGIDDEMLIYTEVYAGGDESWFLVARLETGWTNAIELWRFAGGGTPTLTPSPEGVPAAYDLDGDGGLEFFVDGFGNTARSSAIVSLMGCELRRPRADGEAGDLLRDGLVLIGVGGNSCAPTGCWPRITCTGNVLRVEEVGPTEEWRGQVPDDLADVEMVWTQTDYILGGDAVLMGEDPIVRTFPHNARGIRLEAPATSDSDVIDCTP